MHEIWEFLKTLVNPESIIMYGGLALLLFVIFAETGLMAGFFLPGDSLVFISGLFCGTKPELLGVEIYTLILALCIAAIIGNVSGYYFGKKIGPALFTKDDNIIFKKRYIEITRTFYDKHGGKSLVLGRFFPIIRTFAPILAGVIQMDFKIFMTYNIVGALLWIPTLSLLGFFLGEIIWVQNNLKWIVIFLIIVTLIPIIGTIKKEKVNNKRIPLK
ncbi:MAG: VTT domain-containing protein [Bacteroidota bacterium]